MSCQLCSASEPTTPVLIVILGRLKSAFACEKCKAQGAVVIGATLKDLQQVRLPQ